MPKYSLDWQNWTIIFGIQLMQQKSFKQDSKCCDMLNHQPTVNSYKYSTFKRSLRHVHVHVKYCTLKPNH